MLQWGTSWIKSVVEVIVQQTTERGHVDIWEAAQAAWEICGVVACAKNATKLRIKQVLGECSERWEKKEEKRVVRWYRQYLGCFQAEFVLGLRIQMVAKLLFFELPDDAVPSSFPDPFPTINVTLFAPMFLKKVQPSSASTATWKERCTFLCGGLNWEGHSWAFPWLWTKAPVQFFNCCHFLPPYWVGSFSYDRLCPGKISITHNCHHYVTGMAVSSTSSCMAYRCKKGPFLELSSCTAKSIVLQWTWNPAASNEIWPIIAKLLRLILSWNSLCQHAKGSCHQDYSI